MSQEPAVVAGQNLWSPKTHKVPLKVLENYRRCSSAPVRAPSFLPTIRERSSEDLDATHIQACWGDDKSFDGRVRSSNLRLHDEGGFFKPLEWRVKVLIWANEQRISESS